MRSLWLPGGLRQRHRRCEADARGCWRKKAVILALHILTRSGKELTAQKVFTAADAGDELAGRIVEETALYLAIGAMNLMHVIDPDLIVFGGGMIAAGDGFLERIRAMCAGWRSWCRPSEPALSTHNSAPTPASSARRPAADA